MTPRVFALVMTVLCGLVLLVAGQIGQSVIGDVCCGVSVIAAYVVSLNAAYRAINLGLVRPKKT